ncbi:MAG: ABC transporter permease [Peptococcaceae bacterium]|nr:ABC transporter permease [Peptococcaceae bacterium]
MNLAPIHKMKLLGCDLLVALLIQFAELLILLVYMRFALNVAFGSQLGYILLTCLVGSLVGVSMGIFIGALVKGSEGVKTGVVIGATLTMSFFSGLNYPNVKYMVAKAFPPSTWINPASLITDALYALYYYDTYSRFSLNIGLLFAFSLVFILGAYLVLRRNQYASIPSLLQDN